ncbi:guanylate kinase [endosymbiont of unidentified scaly snail isolate Monju]|uniref:guanylate kinase n=1 Tax=endosymbiont of unidentified scaly snail isolate Monju TaxID=1248727 RepID=UPI0005BB1AD3|nr:guanylate kinase [endosymbiont of unidentified scaly snail isolate Monju]
MTRPSILFIVSAPSGAGKTSLLRELLARDSGLRLSVSHTTRPMRPGEQDGVHYHFVDVETFQHLVAEQAFIEHARVFDNYYGTSEAGVREQLAAGHDVVVEIDWQGARQVRARFPEAVSIFIAPPSIEALHERLGARGQDSEEVIERRMRDARAELSHYAEYDYLVINDRFETALEDLAHIVAAERLRTQRQALRHETALRAMLGE